jgi:hypothetical protein
VLGRYHTLGEKQQEIQTGSHHEDQWASQAVEIILVHPYSLWAFQWYQEHSRFKRTLGGHHKLGKNQPNFQTGSHHED